MPLYGATAALLARYDATVAAHPSLAERLAPVRQSHRAHLDGLAREIGLPVDTTPPATPATPAAPGAPATSGAPSAEVPSTPRAALATIVTAEKDAARVAFDTCLSAPAWRAQLLGSIAAGRACHVEVMAQ